MWICQKCGEPHQDQFKQCWKCVGAEISEHVTAEAPRPMPLPAEREVRSLGSVLFRMSFGFTLGMLGGVAVFHRYGASLEYAATMGAIAGAVLALLVGFVFWVMFPYKPNREQNSDNENGDEIGHLAD